VAYIVGLLAYIIRLYWWHFVGLLAYMRGLYHWLILSAFGVVCGLLVWGCGVMFQRFCFTLARGFFWFLLGFVLCCFGGVWGVCFGVGLLRFANKI